MSLFKGRLTNRRQKWRPTDVHCETTRPSEILILRVFPARMSVKPIPSVWKYISMYLSEKVQSSIFHPTHSGLSTGSNMFDMDCLKTKDNF